jgi:ubiquilin
MLQGGGLGGGANPFAPAPAFPAPGNPNPTATPSTPSSTSPGTTPGAGAVPPFPPLFGAPPGSGAAAGGNLPALQQMFGGGMGSPFGFGPGAGGLGGYGGFGGVPPASPATPADTRPPEERFQVQLQVRFLSFFLKKNK